MKETTIKSNERISLFSVPKETSNEDVLRMIYNDLSKKIDFIKEIYPYADSCGLFMYNVMYKHFNILYEPVLCVNSSIKYYSDTYEESSKAFDNGIFNVERNFFGRGEWPIILFDRVTRSDKDYDVISYLITR